MITVKFVGGAKKSFPAEKLDIDASDITIRKLLDLLLEAKPPDAPDLDTENILIAVNGVDSSAMEGRETRIRSNDLVSIIPVIHGGSAKKLTFSLLKKQVQVIEVKGHKTADVKFLDKLRRKYPKVQLQAVSKNFVLNSYHLKKILSLSLESQKNGVLLSNRLETDILMRFAVTRQISEAIKNAGIKPGTSFILIAVGGKASLNSLYKELLPLSADLFTKSSESFVKKHFKITRKQLDSVHSKNPLEDILIEKAAILL